MSVRNFVLRASGLALAAALIGWLPATAQGRRPAQPAQENGSPFMFETAATDPPPVATHHTITMDGKTLHYTATVGKIPVPDGAGRIEGHMFYVAYTLDNPDPSHPRPVTFSYNGGPGADSVWVDIGGFGPRRAALGDDAQISPPPFTMVDNQQTWLDVSDLVFIDAMGTGYSRATSLANLKRAASVSGDLQAFSEFIRLWLYDNNRLNSPVILAGESYGTFRSAGLAGTLIQHHVPVSGVVLLSSVLNLMTLSPSMSNDRPYWLALPTLTAIAWYHKKLPADLEKEPLPQVVKQAETWASTKYNHYLDEGDTLQGAELKQAIAEMARFTGLPAEFLKANNLRIGTGQFDSRLLQEQGLTVGRYDGEMTGPVRTPGATFGGSDPSSNINLPYDHEWVNYLRNELGYKTKLEYGDRNMGGAGNPGWNYQLGRDWFGTADVTPLLARAFEQEPSMRLMLCEGYFDQATPMFEATNSMKHLFITPAEQTHISIEHYYSGHMLYTHKASRVKLHNDFVNFVHSLAGQH